MKQLIFSLLVLFCFVQTNAQSISIAATEGGSVTFTPDGVVRTAPQKTKAIPVNAPKLKAIEKAEATKPPQEILFYTLKNLDINQARLVMGPFRNALYDENTSKEDYDTFIALRKFIQDNRGFAISTKTITVKVPAAKIDNIFSAGYEGRRELKQKLKQLDLEEGMYKQIQAQEEAAGITGENSKLRVRPDKYKEQ